MTAHYVIKFFLMIWPVSLSYAQTPVILIHGSANKVTMNLALLPQAHFKLVWMLLGTSPLLVVSTTWFEFTPPSQSPHRNWWDLILALVVPVPDKPGPSQGKGLVNCGCCLWKTCGGSTTPCIAYIGNLATTNWYWPLWVTLLYDLVLPFYVVRWLFVHCDIQY